MSSLSHMSSLTCHLSYIPSAQSSFGAFLPPQDSFLSVSAVYTHLTRVSQLPVQEGDEKGDIRTCLVLFLRVERGVCVCV